jgi:uncharacterized membrane protein
MTEPESLATIEGVDEHIRRHSYDRLIMLSDGIFAIATTLAALNVRIPAHAGSLGALLLASARSFIAYALSFAVAGIFWISNRDLFARLRKVDTPLTLLTLTLLSFIALIPATIGTLYLQGGGDPQLRLYGLAMFACGIINTGMWSYAACHPELMLYGVRRRERWVRAGYAASFPILFLPVLLLPSSQFAIVMLPLAFLVFLARRVLLPRWIGVPIR